MIHAEDRLARGALATSRAGKPSNNRSQSPREGVTERQTRDTVKWTKEE